MPSEGSITHKWLPEFKAGNEEAINALWQRFFERIVRQARRHLVGKGVARRVEDEEHVAASVFWRLCVLAKQNDLGRVSRSDDLWALLVTITAGKVVELIRRQTAQKRGGGDVRGESAFQKKSAATEEESGIQGYIADNLSPESRTIVGEEVDRFMELLPDDSTRSVAEWYLQGERITEIARELGITRQVVYRKLELIFAIWREEAGDESL